MRVFLLTEHGFQPANADDVPAILQAETPFWVDMEGPTAEDTRVMKEVFHFHPLAIEDTTNKRQRPKVEQYGNVLFTIVNPVEVKPDKTLEFRELDVFLSKQYIVTVHTGDEALIDTVVATCNMQMEYGVKLSVGYVMYMLTDRVIDGYFPILDQISDEIEDISDQVAANAKPEMLQRLFQVRRDLAEMWRVTGHQRDMFAVLTREDGLISNDALRYYLRDVHDHLLRISDEAHTLRETLSGVVDLYFSTQSNRLNSIVQRLTYATIGVGMLSVIVGFYGMNFERTFPSFSSPLGVPFALLLMVLAIVGLLIARWWIER